MAPYSAEAVVGTEPLDILESNVDWLLDMDEYTCNRFDVVTLVKMREAINVTWIRIVLDVEAAGKCIYLYVEVLC